VIKEYDLKLTRDIDKYKAALLAHFARQGMITPGHRKRRP
jgi:hypothetical protein